MTGNKVVFHQFDPIIYPVKIWVVVTNNNKIINERFESHPDGLPLLFDFENFNAGIFRVVNKEDGLKGVLIIFSNKKALTPKIIAHETAHATEEIWEYLNESRMGNEANAYLTGWIVDCIWQVKTNKFR